MSESPLILPRHLRLEPHLVLAVICLALLAVITYFVGTGATTSWDHAIILAMAPLRTPLRTAIWRTISALGLGEAGIPIGILVVLILRHARHFRQANFYLWLTLGGWGFNILLKQLISRPRPDLIPHLSGAGWFSFPSGHAMLAPMVYGAGALLLATLLAGRWQRVALRAMGWALVVAIGCSRVYLGVHWPSDVLAGWLAGTGWVLLWWGLISPNHLLLQSRATVSAA